MTRPRSTQEVVNTSAHEQSLIKLETCRKVILHRGELKAREKRQAEDAYHLLKVENVEGLSTKRQGYQRFLRKVQEQVGYHAALLCAVALGQYTISLMKDTSQISLIEALNSRVTTLNNDIISKLLVTASKDLLTTSSTEAEGHVTISRTGLEQPSMLIHHSQPKQLIMQGSSLTGDVYKLTVRDALNAAMISQDVGEVLLTVPYDTHSMPFVTITISREASDQYAAQRPQIM